MPAPSDRPHPGTAPPPDAVAAAGLTLNAPALKGIRQLSALETVRARIALAVDLGLLVPGERLPPNEQIADALGVSEITVRRALVSLGKEGVLERRRGRNGGTLVAPRPPKGVVDATAAYRSDATAAAVHQLIDHRLALECGIAHLASGHAGPSAIEGLDALVDEMDHLVGWAEFHGCDERFHLALAAATGLSSIIEPYTAVLHDLYRYYLPYPVDTLRESNREHRELVAAIRRGDATAAARVAQQHVEVLHRTMFVALLDG
ncbi:FadR/GntR family transcriptional regulator [Streptomyces sp. NPDC093589]|uniref:FadR/GntR family transcriptional regulator n=1 Tax=Streptomyces sp. NPDC093589 TaxID=3366043 RepID=UPI00382502AA